MTDYVGRDCWFHFVFCFLVGAFMFDFIVGAVSVLDLYLVSSFQSNRELV